MRRQAFTATTRGQHHNDICAAKCFLSWSSARVFTLHTVLPSLAARSICLCFPFFTFPSPPRPCALPAPRPSVLSWASVFCYHLSSSMVGPWPLCFCVAPFILKETLLGPVSILTCFSSLGVTLR